MFKTFTAQDALAIAATLGRAVVKWIVELGFGPQTVYPTLNFGRDDPQDLTVMIQALAQLVPLGLDVDINEVRTRLGFSEPKPGARLLRAPAAPIAQTGVSALAGFIPSQPRDDHGRWTSGGPSLTPVPTETPHPTEAPSSEPPSAEEIRTSIVKAALGKPGSTEWK